MPRRIHIALMVLTAAAIVLTALYDGVVKQYLPGWAQSLPGWMIVAVVGVVGFLAWELYLSWLDRHREIKRRRQQNVD